MSDFDAADALVRYSAWQERYPERFVNPSGDIYQILFERGDVARAQRMAERVRKQQHLPHADLRVGVLAEDPYVTLIRDAVRFPDGAYGLYNRVMVPAGAAVLPRLGDSLVLLYRFRHGTRQWVLEAPRGSFSGDAPEAAEARRELFEEIGATAGDLIDLGELHSSTGCFDERHRLFLATVPAIGAAEKHEAIAEIKVLPIADVEQLIAKGAITDGPTLALFLRARLRGLV